MNSKKTYYAYYLPHGGTSGVVRSWEECHSYVQGAKEARYKKFSTHEEALEFIYVLLQEGVKPHAYPAKNKGRMPLQDIQTPALFFDSGTGRKIGVEISVTDTNGKSQLTLLEKDTPYLEHALTEWGSYILTGDYTNNFGELLALYFALLIAEKMRILHIYGDSRLVIDYWSLGFINKEKLSSHTVVLAQKVQNQRKAFEHLGGTIHHIHGDQNPADMGFHK